jgi:hypothetical protein
LLQAVKKVVTWVKEHCSVSVEFPSGVGVSCKLNRKRRDAARLLAQLPEGQFIFIDLLLKIDLFI